LKKTARGREATELAFKRLRKSDSKKSGIVVQLSFISQFTFKKLLR
jgi:hypothetical protein